MIKRIITIIITDRVNEKRKRRKKRKKIKEKKKKFFCSFISIFLKTFDPPSPFYFYF